MAAVGGFKGETPRPLPPGPDWGSKRIALDDTARADLPATEGKVAAVLDDWVMRRFGTLSSHHGVGLFLDLLEREGLVVVEQEQLARLLHAVDEDPS